ncbi:MAG TPA: sulfotransferase [Anaerolineales bacterium]|nr:sulfotransferase [Anaerolineales bacterium]
MNANVLEITARKRQNPLGVADPSDFEFSEGSAIDPQIVVTSPLISLYCLDHVNQRALFVETQQGVDLTQAPFFYQAQYENMVRLIAVPYERLHQLASNLSLDSSRLILVYSTGRSGSTLLGAALNAVEGTVSYSEPDVFTQLVAIRQADAGNEADVSALIQSCTKLLCKGTERIPTPSHWVIKFRSFAIELGDLFHSHFPQAKNIFLYRHAEGYMASTLRAFVGNSDTPEFRAGIQGWLSTLVPPIAKHMREGGSLLNFSSISAVCWLRTMERYMQLQEQGMPGLAIRYEDLKSAPQDTIHKIIEYCGISMESMEAVYQVFEKDSQSGSALSQENVGQKDFKLTDAHKADLARALEAHPFIKSADFVIPTA